MLAILNLVAKISVLAFVVSSMLAMGAGLTVAEILAPLRNARLVGGALLANFVLMPLAAILLARVLRLEESLATGLLLAGCTAGAPFLPKLAQLARGSLAFAVGLMVLLMVVTIAFLPVALPKLIPAATVDPEKIARSLFVLMLLPLMIGLILRARHAPVAARVKPWLDKISSLSIVLIVILIIGLNLERIAAIFGSHGILAALLYTVLALGIGWVLGGATRDTRSVMALGTAQRNIGAALVVAGTLGDQKVSVMVIVVAVVGLVVLLPAARVLGKR